MHFFRASLIAVILLFSSSIPARAQCVTAAYAETNLSVVANIAANMLEVSTWLLTHLAGEHVKPAFAVMAEQWSTADLKIIESYAKFSDDQQQDKAVKTIEAMKASFVADLQPSEELCDRVSQSAGVVSSRLNSENAEKSLLKSFSASATSANGSPAGMGSVNYSLARYDHYLGEACSRGDLAGALDAFCVSSNPIYIDSDIDPAIHFSGLTVESNNPEGSTGAIHLNAFAENICGGKVLTMLPGSYFGNGEGTNVLSEVNKFWQYSAFCRASIVSYAAFKSPGSTPFSASQIQTLLDAGYRDEAEINLQYGENPSLNAFMDLILTTYSSPKKMAVDQMEKKNTLLAYDAIGMATELMLLDKYKDIYAQETRNLSLYLALKLSKQRDVANASVLAVSYEGSRGL